MKDKGLARAVTATTAVTAAKPTRGEQGGAMG